MGGRGGIKGWYCSSYMNVVLPPLRPDPLVAASCVVLGSRGLRAGSSPCRQVEGLLRVKPCLVTVGRGGVKPGLGPDRKWPFNGVNQGQIYPRSPRLLREWSADVLLYEQIYSRAPAALPTSCL